MNVKTIIASLIFALVAGPEAVARVGVTCGQPLEVQLTAGQTINAGKVIVRNDATQICVSYEATGDWYLSETHLHIAKDLAAIPQTRAGNPQPGRFALSTRHEPYVKSFEYCVSLESLGLVAGDQVVIAAHASLVRVADGVVVQQETGWGNGEGFSGANWAMHFAYTVQACGGGPGGDRCETAFAFGDMTFADVAAADPAAFPQGAGNRWGWQITVPADGAIHVQDIWAGAAQNDTSKGTRVGVLEYSFDGTILQVRFILSAGFTLRETHVYAGSEPTDTFAPGQYGHSHEGLNDPAADEYTILIDSGSGIIYLIAHAVVCGI